MSNKQTKVTRPIERIIIMKPIKILNRKKKQHWVTILTFYNYRYKRNKNSFVPSEVKKKDEYNKSQLSDKTSHVELDPILE